MKNNDLNKIPLYIIYYLNGIELERVNNNKDLGIHLN